MSDIAFYYPGHIWYDTDRIKSMLLFYDGIGFLIPEYKKGEPENVDPILAAPLRDKGLLQYFVADEVIDESATSDLATAMGRLFERGSLNHLMEQDTQFHSLSMSRLGYGGNRALAEKLYERLLSMGLAKESTDGSSIPMHPTVRYLILVMLAQILRGPSAKKGIDLSPITDRQQILNSLTELLNIPTAPSAGQVIQFDLQAVSADLSAIPLDEVLDYRNQNIEAHKLYMRSLRQFAREVSLLPAHEQDAALADRQAALDDYAADIKRVSRAAWRKPAAVGLGLAGAAWAATGDPLSALFAVGGVALTEFGAGDEKLDAYSYLVSIGNRL
ncbi:MAG: hypothetical protein LAT61_09105 [Alcanivorax sp.]|nr:hypothetical protein [Alcanivorax sp.]